MVLYSGLRLRWEGGNDIRSTITCQRADNHPDSVCCADRPGGDGIGYSRYHGGEPVLHRAASIIMFISSGTADALSLIDLSVVDIAAVKLTLDGAFDDRISELKSLKAELDAKQLIVNTIDAANKLKAEAQSEADAVAVRIKAADARNADLSARENAVAAQLSEVDSAQAALSIAQNDFSIVTQKRLAQVKAAEDAVAGRESALAQAILKLQSDTDILEAQKKAFNDKLAALRA